MPITCLPPSLSEQSSAEQSRAVLSYRPAHWVPKTRPGGQHPNARPSNGGVDPPPLNRRLRYTHPSDGLWIASSRRYLVIPCVWFRAVDRGSDGARAIVCAGGFHSCQGFGVNPHVWYCDTCHQACVNSLSPLVHISLFRLQVLFNFRPEANEWGELTTKVCGCYVVRFSMFSNFYPLD